jgi:membrane associated rhomboid family serine protease
MSETDPRTLDLDRTAVPGGAVHTKHPPMFNAPGIVVGLLGLLIAVHAGFALLEWLGQDQRAAWWGWTLALVPQRYFGAAHDIPGGTVAAVTSLVTHTLLHNDLAHLFINGAFLLAFGAMVARRIGALRFLALYLGSAVAGALLYLAVNGNTDAVVVGASGAISGLFGGAFRFAFRALQMRRHGIALDEAQFVPRMTLAEMIADPQVRAMLVAWLIVNTVIGLAMPLFGEGGIAWEAHLGGFLFGLLAFGLFDVLDAQGRTKATSTKL